MKSNSDLFKESKRAVLLNGVVWPLLAILAALYTLVSWEACWPLGGGRGNHNSWAIYFYDTWRILGTATLWFSAAIWLFCWGYLANHDTDTRRLYIGYRAAATLTGIGILLCVIGFLRGGAASMEY